MTNNPPIKIWSDEQVYEFGASLSTDAFKAQGVNITFRSGEAFGCLFDESTLQRLLADWRETLSSTRSDRFARYDGIDQRDQRLTLLCDVSQIESISLETALMNRLM